MTITITITVAAGIAAGLMSARSPWKVVSTPVHGPESGEVDQLRALDVEVGNGDPELEAVPGGVPEPADAHIALVSGAVVPGRIGAEEGQLTRPRGLGGAYRSRQQQGRENLPLAHGGPGSLKGKSGTQCPIEITGDCKDSASSSGPSGKALAVLNSTF